MPRPGVHRRPHAGLTGGLAELLKALEAGADEEVVGEKGSGAQLEAFSRSLPFDYRLAQADIVGTKAYVRALERERVLSSREAARSLQALDALAEELPPRRAKSV